MRVWGLEFINLKGLLRVCNKKKQEVRGKYGNGKNETGLRFGVEKPRV
jgi:hypothetical protein